MKSRLRLPSTLVLSVLAALTTWLTLTTWSGFSEDSGAYLRPLAVGCAIVAISGALLRSARLHPILVVVGQVALVVLWLNHRFAPDPSILGWLPTAQSVRDSFDLLTASADAANAYPSPVPESVPVFPAILIAVGSLLAVLVDLLACGARRVPLSGLPLLAMYTAPVSILEDGVPWWKFALIALAFLLLLAGEEATRLAHWGRDLGSTGEHRWRRTTNQTVWPSARKIGVTATAVAVVIPVFIPTFTGGILGGAGSGAGGSGDGVRIDNPMLNMLRDLTRSVDAPAVQVTTDDPSPEYLRLAVLDEYDGNSWIPSKREIPVEQRVGEGLPLPTGLTDDAVSATEYEYDFVAHTTFDSSWLPVPFPALTVDVAGDWRYDTSTMDILSAAEDEDIAGKGYAATGLDVEPTADDLRNSVGTPTELFVRYTEQSEIPEWVEGLAEQVTDRGVNKAERAALLQDWFAKPHTDPAQGKDFRYDLIDSERGSGVDALTDFLRNSRVGYCEQFAGSMALMARAIEIPARIAVGFLKPDRVSPGSDSWMFSLYDLHAWPELYFDGVGWVRFEPTPGARPGALAPPFTDELVTGTVPTGEPTTGTTSPTPTSTAPTAPSNIVPTEGDPTPNTSTESGRPWPLVVLLAVPLLVLVSSVPMLARILVRRRRWAAAASLAEEAEAAWDELRDSMIDLRLPWDDQVTVRQRAKEIVPLFRRRPGPGEEHLARVITNNPEAEAALDRIVLLVERARYARSVPDLADIRRDVELCVTSLGIGVEPNVRRRAVLLPVSLLKRSRRVNRGESGLAALDEPSLTP
ncbi:MAG TPA: DUF3488 and transglutaminase-like domain-containing protein [Nocardioidaceae bacterium]|nr:DUF3488 and transglutaminase-like domain-containing protein [Nocardioidaceae bacterium]